MSRGGCSSRGDGNGWQGSRDRARTPMQWDGSAAAGFTRAAAPWLPIGDSTTVNVADQRDDPSSVLSLCRDLLSLRRAEFGGQLVSYQPLPAPPGGWAYRAGSLTVLANFSGHPITCQDPGKPVLYHLLWAGTLVTDLASVLLSGDSVVAASGGAAS